MATRLADLLKAQKAKLMAPKPSQDRIPLKPRKGKPKAAVPAAKDSNGPPAKGQSGHVITAAETGEIFRIFQAANPEPKGELEHVNAFTLLVAVVLSAQATDAGVNKATRSLFKIADSPAKMLRLGEDKVREAVKTIGLYRTKAKNVIALSERLIAVYGGEVPKDREALESLPGVGRKTANVVLNMAFGEPTMAVDTHVFRVANRIGLSKGKTPVVVEEDLMRIIPRAYAMHAHHWLILHGRYLCKARKPECWRCPIAGHCTFAAKIPAAS
jgi:endonuclease III